ncbi:MAG: DNA mismatch repair endonuclease MutL, partial [Elusimicrobiota bacterium]
GFRGEALHSILSVSKLSISSYREGDSGNSICGQAGNIISESNPPPVKGTTVEVRDLFFNVPARAKFLRSDASERAHLIRTVESMALANLKVGFFLKVDDSQVFAAPPAPDADFWDVLNFRAKTVLGKNIAENLTKIECRTEKISVLGLVSKSEGLIATRLNQFLFVNKRPVTSRVMQQALYKGYEYLRGNKHPACVLFIEMPVSDFDVNIHPQKKDVKFKNENEVFKIISVTISNEIRKSEKPVSLIAVKENTVTDKDATGKDAYATSDTVHEQSLPYHAAIEKQSVDTATGKDATGKDTCATIDIVQADWYCPPLIYVGQIAKTYLVFESGGGMLVIDQHAAQERILFEKYLNELSGGEIRVQPLILPVSIELSRSQIETIMKWKEWLYKAGFEIELFGTNTVLLHSTPSIFYFTPEALQEFLGYLSEVLGDPEKSTEELKRKTVATLACKRSVKARERLKESEALKLVEDLKWTHDSLHCPHGRPTVLYLSKDDLARKFQRTTPP